MSAAGRILIVDDEPFNREILRDILTPDFEVALAKSGSECIEMVPNFKPELILLDVSMPGMSGYDVCRELKSNHETKEIQITFVSALDTLADRLAGYEAGGDDYVTKPFQGKELLRKVNVALSNKAKTDGLKADMEFAKRVANNALASTNEIGRVLQFLNATFHCHELQSLSQLVIDTIASFGYRSTVQIRSGEEEINNSSDGHVNPLEVTVMNRISTEDQCIDIGPRTIINMDCISILVKGVSHTDREEYEKLKENMMVIAEGAEVRINTLRAQADLMNQAGLLQAIRHAQDTLTFMSENKEKIKRQLPIVMDKLHSNLTLSVESLGLSQDQAQILFSLIRDTRREVLALFEKEQAPKDTAVDAVLVELNDVINH